MTIRESLQDIIQDDAHIPLAASPNNKSSTSLIIKETNESASFKQVTLSDVPAQTFAWKLDCKKIQCGKKHKLSPYFSDGKNLDKGCDAVIVSKIKSQWYICILELKSKQKRKQQEIVKQFKSSLCFVKYIQAILRIIYEQHDINNAKFQCVLFSPDAHNNLRGTKHNKANLKIDGIPIQHLRDTQCSMKKFTQ